MRKVLSVLAAGLVLLAQPASEVSAQMWDAGLPGEDVASFGLHVGAVSPTTTLPDGGSFDSGIAFGASGTYWALRHLGFRGSVYFSQTDGQQGEGFSPAATQDPDVWFYGADVLIRRPMDAGGLAWAPYVAAGAGGKSYRWSVPSPRVGGTAFAWSVGAGLDLRPAGSPWYGLVLDVRSYFSDYEWHGFQPNPETMTDLVFTAGISLNR